MTMPVRGFGGPGNMVGPRQIKLDVAGETAASRPSATPEGKNSFADTLKRALEQTSRTQEVAQDYMDRFVRGEAVDLRQVTAAAQAASVSLETLVELRNRLADSYKSVMQMG